MIYKIISSGTEAKIGNTVIYGNRFPTGTFKVVSTGSLNLEEIPTPTPLVISVTENIDWTTINTSGQDVNDIILGNGGKIFFTGDRQ